MVAADRQNLEGSKMKKPVCKICRRIGEKLFLKGERCFTPKCALIRRNYPPGMHGQKKQRSLSEYGRQIKEKKKVKFKNQGISLVDKVYELKLAPSLKAARQLISHGHILVNNKKINIPSYKIKPSDLPIRRQDLSADRQDTIKSIKIK